MKSTRFLTIFSILLGTGILLGQAPGLNQRLAEKKAENLSKIDDSSIKVMQDATDALRASGILDSALNVEDEVPNFTLPNVFGKDISIKKLYKKGPIVITFYRGGWCPYCNITLAAYQDALEQITGNGGSLIAISPEKVELAADTMKNNDLKFDVLFDKDNEVARQFGIVFELTPELQELYMKFGINLAERNGTDSFDLPLAATYVINRQGKIVYAFLNEDYTKRADPAIIAQLLKMWK